MIGKNNIVGQNDHYTTLEQDWPLSMNRLLVLFMPTFMYDMYDMYPYNQIKSSLPATPHHPKFKHLMTIIFHIPSVENHIRESETLIITCQMDDNNTCVSGEERTEVGCRDSRVEGSSELLTFGLIKTKGRPQIHMHQSGTAQNPFIGLSVSNVLSRGKHVPR